jgi:hypothetical protein
MKISRSIHFKTTNVACKSCTESPNTFHVQQFFFKWSFLEDNVENMEELDRPKRTAVGNILEIDSRAKTTRCSISMVALYTFMLLTAMSAPTTIKWNVFLRFHDNNG